MLFYIKMKIIINIVASIVFIVQFVSFVFNALNLKKPGCTIDSLYNYFVIIAYLCSLFAVIIFAVQYNFKAKYLNNKLLNCIFLIIVMLGTYIHLSQLLLLKDFVLTSCILLLFDIYIIHKILRNLFIKQEC